MPIKENKRPSFEFSSAESLESLVSLVSGADSEATEVILNPERGTREKRFHDGKVITWIFECSLLK